MAVSFDHLFVTFGNIRASRRGSPGGTTKPTFDPNYNGELDDENSISQYWPFTGLSNDWPTNNQALRRRSAKKLEARFLRTQVSSFGEESRYLETSRAYIRKKEEKREKKVSKSGTMDMDGWVDALAPIRNPDTSHSQMNETSETRRA